MNETSRTGRSKKRKSKKSRTGSRSSSKRSAKGLSSGDENPHLKPDLEAEEIAPKRKASATPRINKEELFRPITPKG